MHPMLNIAVKAARKAGSIINRASIDVDLVRVSRKQHNDFVTEVDRAAEAAIIEVIRTAYPEHAILAEESGQSWAEGDDQHEFTWVIDPLDGTTNFIHGFPQYAVSIGLLHKGVPSQAVVYDPTRDELFTASKGAGAFLNNRRIRVTTCSAALADGSRASCGSSNSTPARYPTPASSDGYPGPRRRSVRAVASGHVYSCATVSPWDPRAVWSVNAA